MTIPRYNPDKNPDLKTPYYCKYENGDEVICDRYGENQIAIKWGDHPSNCRDAKSLLEKYGYRTDFAKWDEDGRLIEWIEEIEK